MNRKMITFLALILMAALAAPAAAENGFNAQLFWPSIFGGNFVAIEDADTLCFLGFGGGLILNYADGPVELRVGDDPELGVLNTLLTGDVLLGFGPTSWMSLGVDVPVHLYSRGRTFEDVEKTFDPSGLKSETSLGDIRAEIKFQALEQEKHWLGMAIAPYVTFPTGDPGRFLGEGRVTFGGTLALERDFKVLNVGLNGGYMYRGDQDVVAVNIGDVWKLGAGISRGFDFGLSFSVEYWSSWYDSGSQEQYQSNPMELMGTLRYEFGKGPRLLGGAGGGGTSGVGCPAYRLMAGVDYYYCKPEPTDGKLIVHTVNQSGAPVQANIQVGGPINVTGQTNARGNWKTKTAAGSYSVTASADCYVQGEGQGEVQVGQTTEVTVRLTRVPTQLVLQVTDKYTGKKLDSRAVLNQGTRDEKALSVTDGNMTMEVEAGAYKLIVSAKGYEDLFLDANVATCQDNVVEVKLRKKIEKIDKIYFDFDSAVIRKKSYRVLDDVVKQINRLEKFSKIIIEGHCSSEGTDEYNMGLATRRSTSVKDYLSNKGIDPSKLEISPYGESRPIATNETEEGRSMNRRVEFIIEEE